ncbi:MAG: HutP [Erysipelotrichia bacterium]|nr:HutP family protein [Candidatus Riflebacteria bacterium]NCB37408.1 HutP [Erysipelotrichia bacterium]
MSQLAFENVLLQEGRVSLSKAAMLCSMIDNDLDDDLITFLRSQGVSAVITRAGGSGDNLKSKILRNTFGAAENSGLVAINMKNRHAITQLIDGIFRSFDGPLTSVTGGGLKIGLAVRGSDIAMGIFGTLGLPGLEVDYEISASRILYHCLED